MTPREQLRERIGAQSAGDSGEARRDRRRRRGEEAPRENAGEDEKKEEKKEPQESRLASYLGIFVAALITLVINYFIVVYNNKKTVDKLWLPKELALYNGSDPSLPLLLSITGTVFDVTKGKEHYGEGQSYNQFCGRDASRAFVTGDFTEKGLISDTHGLSYHQLDGLSGWVDFYNKNYPVVGKLVGKFYSSDGKPTRDLIHLNHLFEKVKLEIERQKQLESLHPNCNSRYSSKEGGQVWCEVGYPRKVPRFSSADEMRGKKTYRCACYEENELEEMDETQEIEEYENCSPFSNVCQTSPPQ